MLIWVKLHYRDGYDSYEQSRATSGRVSPSDLPDSPCQSPPPKGGHQHPRVPTLPIQRPYHQQQPSAVSRPQPSRATAPNAQQNQSNAIPSHTTLGCFPPANTSMQPSLVAAENGRKEKVETEEKESAAGVLDEGATPACFSSRTSISRLTFSDDDDDDQEDKIEPKDDKLNPNQPTSSSADAAFKPTKVSVNVLKIKV